MSDAHKTQRNPWALITAILAGSAVVTLCTTVVLVKFCLVEISEQWLLCSALVPAAGALLCVAVFRWAMTLGLCGQQGKNLAVYGGYVALGVAIAVVPALVWQARLEKKRARACVANLRNIDGAMCQAPIEEPAVAFEWRSSDEVPPSYLKNPKAVRCPCARNEPYIIFRLQPFCPAFIRNPKKHAHTLYGGSEEMCKFNLYVITDALKSMEKDGCLSNLVGRSTFPATQIPQKYFRHGSNTVECPCAPGHPYMVTSSGWYVRCPAQLEDNNKYYRHGIVW